MKTTGHWKVCIVALAVTAGLNTPARAVDGYIAAVGVGTNSLRYLQVPRIMDIGGAPTVGQTQADLSADFDSVEDVAFLRSVSADRLVAVLGNCRDFVPSETYDPYEGCGGYTHQLQGKVAIYKATASGDLMLSGPLQTVSFDHTIATTRRTVSYPQSGRQYGETWRLAGLAGGGFAVNASDVPRTGVRWQPDRFNPYNWLLAFDNTYTFRFRASMWLGYADGGANDVAGFVSHCNDAVASTWLGVSGTPTGVLRRYRINWIDGTLVEEAAMSGAVGWIFYVTSVAPLTYIGPQPTLSGGVVVGEGNHACNAAREFTSGNLDSAKGWGNSGVVPGGQQAIGLNSDGVNLMVAFRCAGETNRLYRVAPVNGTYNNTGFSFVWEGSPWTITAADGDAMAFSVIVPRLAMSLAGSSVHLQWNSAAGQSYQAYTSTNLPSNQWLPWGGVMSGTGDPFASGHPNDKRPGRILSGLHATSVTAKTLARRCSPSSARQPIRWPFSGRRLARAGIYSRTPTVSAR